MSGSPKVDTLQRGLAVLCVVGPIVFAVASIVAGIFRSDFSYVADPNSRLGEAGSPYATVWNAGVIFLGVSVLALGLAVYRSMDSGSRIGSALLALSVVGFVGVAIFPCDPECPVSGSFANNAHKIVGQIQIAQVFGVAMVSLKFKKDALWKKYYPYSVATVVAWLAIGALSSGLSPLHEFVVQWQGALVWSLATVNLLWLEVIAIRLLRLSRTLLPPSH